MGQSRAWNQTCKIAFSEDITSKTRTIGVRGLQWGGIYLVSGFATCVERVSRYSGFEVKVLAQEEKQIAGRFKTKYSNV